MASAAQMRGALLEEVVLGLLAANGYQSVDSPGNDETLQFGGAGLEVRGRGTWHQIDAIANYRFSPPFLHPLRLLVEAKSISRRVGVDVVRSAHGVISDVSQFWVGSRPARYCYQYAVFADTEFSERAQDFAFAHNIYLLPLQRASFLRPVLDALRQISDSDFEELPEPVGGQNKIRSIRLQFRDALRDGVALEFAATNSIDRLATLVAAARAVRHGVLAVTPAGLPLFLVPGGDTDLSQLPNEVSVAIRWNDDGWLLEQRDGPATFSFDLPTVLFERYAEFGALSEASAVALKQNELATLTAWLFVLGVSRRIVFRLDQDWINQVLKSLPSES